jgi:hypothetical protein
VFAVNSPSGLETELEPIGAEDHLQGEDDEEDQEDKTTPAACAGGASPKTKASLEPVKEHIQH